MIVPSQVQIYGDSILKGVQLDRPQIKNIFFRRKIIWNAGANTSPSPCRTIPNLAAPWKKAFKLSGANWRNGKKPRAAIQWFFWNTAATTSTMIGRRLTPILPGTTIPTRNFRCFAQVLRGMVEFVREQGMTPVMMNLPPVDSIKYLNWYPARWNRYPKGKSAPVASGSGNYLSASGAVFRGMSGGLGNQYAFDRRPLGIPKKPGL